MNNKKIKIEESLGKQIKAVFKDEDEDNFDVSFIVFEDNTYVTLNNDTFLKDYTFEKASMCVYEDNTAKDWVNNLIVLGVYNFSELIESKKEYIKNETKTRIEKQKILIANTEKNLEELKRQLKLLKNYE